MRDRAGDEEGDAAPPVRRWLRPAGALLAFLVGCALATGGLTTWVDGRGGAVAAPGPGAGPSAAAAAGPPGSLARVAALQPLLDRRAGAVRDGRRADWAGTLDPSPAAAGFRATQLAEFDRIGELPVQRWRYQVLETSAGAGPAADDAFSARVRLTYRLPGDTRDVERVQRLTVARRGASWVVTGVRREGHESDPWELGRLSVLTGRRSIVIGVDARAGATLRRVVTDADDAAARVDAVWGTAWRRTVVVVVPPDLTGMAEALGGDVTGAGATTSGGGGPSRPTAGLDQVAAVTSGDLAVDRTTDGGTADRVVLNPVVFGRLSPLGRRVVLTHEFTHVATRAAVRQAVPLWLEEGFANYVAYRGTRLSPGVVAADVLPLVRAGTAEDRLPGPDAFDPRHASIAPAYADAWLALDLMARDGGRRPLDFYRAAAGLDGASPGGLAGAFRRVLGTDQPTFEARWRAYRRTVAGESSP